MSKRKELVGQTFGRLVVLSLCENRDKSGSACWHCQCDCGNICDVRGYSLTSGATKSCGCLVKENHGIIKDFTGKTFGRLTVLHITNRKSKGGNYYWRCLCTCGNEVSVKGGNLTSGEVQSCGCLHTDWLDQYNSIYPKKGIFRKETGEPSFNRLYGSYKNGAKNRELVFELTKDEFREITSNPCYYCGKEPEQILTVNSGNGIYTYNGIDRINNIKGYTKENCVPCCKQCNFAKRDLTPEDYKDFIIRPYKHIKTGE